MNSNELLDQVKAALGLPSDYALAKKIFKTSPQSVMEMRERGLSDARALQIATILHLDPGEVLAWVHAERAQDKDVKKAWEKLAKSLRSAAAALLVGVIVLLGITPPEAHAKTVSDYVLCEVQDMRHSSLT